MARGGVDIPPSNEPYFGVAQYGGNVGINQSGPTGLPSQFYPNSGGSDSSLPFWAQPQRSSPDGWYGNAAAAGGNAAPIDTGNGFWDSAGRVAGSGLRGAKGGLIGAGAGLLFGGARELFRNRAQPVQNLTADQLAAMAQGQQPGGQAPGFSGGNLFGNLFSGAPINQGNWQTYNTNTQHGNGGAAGTNAFERSGNGIYSGRTQDRADSAESNTEMGNQAAIGFGSNYTGNTQDAGHDQFSTGQGSRFMGRMVDGVLEHVPTSYDARLHQASQGGGNTTSPTFGMSAPGAGDRYAQFLRSIGYGGNQIGHNQVGTYSGPPRGSFAQPLPSDPSFGAGNYPFQGPSQINPVFQQFNPNPAPFQGPVR